MVACFSPCRICVKTNDPWDAVIPHALDELESNVNCQYDEQKSSEPN